MAFVAPVVTGFSSALSGASVCKTRAVARRSGNVVSMKVSQSMPFMEVPAPLEDESIPGNVGFDPLSLSTTFDFKFLQEAEIKHCRVAMLATLGWVFPELWVFPGVQNLTPPEAHAFFVKTGSMSQLLLWISFLEVFGTVALLETINGDRAPGYFGFDPLGLGKNPETFKKYQLAELKNGRLAMCAIGGFFHSWLLTKQGIIEQLTHFKPIPGHVYLW